MPTAQPLTVDAAAVRRWLAAPYADFVVTGALVLAVVIDQSDPMIVLAGLLATAPHALRRQYPWLTLAMTLAGGLGLLFVSGYRPRLTVAAVGLSGALSFYTLLKLLDRRLAWGLVILVAVAGAVVGTGLGNDLVAGLLLAAVAVAIGLAADLRRSRTEVKEVKQESVEQVIAAQREQAAMAERARIAREMHDVVAHSISMVAVQAEAAPYTLSDLSDETKAEFAEIAAAARGTLAEMRRLLGVLRADITTVPETAPQPGLARLDELIGQHEGEVDLDVVGEQVELPQAVDVSAYRIIQECLANASRHAPGSRVSIELAYRPNVLVLRVANDGEVANIAEGGHGLIGMRERALGLGGWFSAEALAGGGFLVKAGLPLE